MSTKFQSKKYPKKEKTFEEALLALGLPALLTRQILFSLRDDEDILDLMDKRKKVEGPTAPPQRQEKKAKPKEEPKTEKKPEKPKEEKPKEPKPTAPPAPEPAPPDLIKPEAQPPWEPPQYDGPAPPTQADPILVFTTMRDAKVDDTICLPLDYSVYLRSDPDRPHIPGDLHPNCRCRYVDAITGMDYGQI